MVSRLDLLRRMPFFSMLTASQAVLVVDAVVKRRYRKGKAVVEQGKKSCALSILLTGRARVVSTDTRDSRQDMAKMVGASREMASRVMKDLEERGFIETQDDGSLRVKPHLDSLV